MNYTEKYQQWLDHVQDEQLRAQLLAMTEEDKRWAFESDLSFGTAGLRGKMCPGTNCVNVYTIYRASEGLARYMAAHGMSKCAVTYDSRLNGSLFAEIAAATFASHGCTVYLTRECMPTPYLSFIVRQLSCDVGVNITASHNPAEYNGYKVYSSDGCQLLDEAAAEVTSYIEDVDMFAAPLPVFAEFVGKSIVYTDDQLMANYLQAVSDESLDKIEDIRIAYTSLNGAAGKWMSWLINKYQQFDEIACVLAQLLPDGNFDTCPYPNPESDDALTLVKELAQQINADLVLANDPDGDRLGVAVRSGKSYVRLSGNEVGMLLCDYILTRLAETNSMPADPIVVKTIVSTDMVDDIARDFGARVVDVLTGFKYIGNVVTGLEGAHAEDNFVFGFEESCGYLKGSYVRDKDGIVAAMLVAQCASYWKKHGCTLVERLDALYDKYGYRMQQTLSYSYGSDEQGRQQAVAALRSCPIERLGSSKVVDVCDFLNQQQYDLPAANVLRYCSENGCRLIVRPSGTEPLVKCYISVKGDRKRCKSLIDAIQRQTDALFAGGELRK